MKRERYQERPERFEYRLTSKGIDLWPVVMALLQWGDRHEALPEGPPVLIVHKGCGGELDGHRCCSACGAKLEAWDVQAHPGPGFLQAAS